MRTMSAINSFFLALLRCTKPLRALLSRLQSARISLIEDEELTKLLKESGRWDALVSGNLHCSHCDCLLTPENLAGFTVDERDYRFLCDSQACLSMKNKR
jgi:hypothetical protein